MRCTVLGSTPKRNSRRIGIAGQGSVNALRIQHAGTELKRPLSALVERTGAPHPSPPRPVR
jgi:hypothetical protein